MKHRGLVIGGVAVIAVGVLVAWVASNTRWEEVQLPTAMRGEARTNRFYAMEKLATQLGARTSREAYFMPPPVGDVIYVSRWNWDLAAGRRQQLEEWVEAGGRLVVDNSVYWYDDEHFSSWSGIHSRQLQLDKEERERRLRELRDEPCAALTGHGESSVGGMTAGRAFVVCYLDAWTVLETGRAVRWGLGDEDGLRALRVPVGKGTLTRVLSAVPFSGRNLLQEDQAALFVATMQLRAGDHLHILSEAEYPSLLALGWRYGWPVFVLGLMALALALWRGGTRFGPLLPTASPTRRSLAEQIRGVGRFAVRHGGAGALHAASRRALERSARQRIPGFDELRGEARADALARAAGLEAPDLNLALQPPDAAGPRHLLAAIVQLETVRRRLLSQPTGRIHGS